MARNLTTDDVKTIYELVSKLSPEWTDTFAVDDSEGEEKPKKLSIEQLKALFTPYNGATNDVDLGDKIIEARKGLFGNIVNNLTTTDEGYIADARQLKALKDLVDELKGIGWTDETLASLGLRLTTLEGTGAGSIAKAIDDALESIETDKTLTVSSAAADAKVTGDKVGELKSAINFVDADFEFAPGTNLIDANKIINGYELKNTIGTIGAKTGWYVTDWVEVKPNTKYTLSGTSSNYRAEVDSTKSSYTGRGSYTATFTTGANTKYVRFNSLISGYSTPQLQEGDTATAYEPFEMVSYWKKNIDEFRTIGSNLFDTETAVKAHSLSTGGASSSNSSYWHTDYIDVNGYNSILVSAVARVLRYCFYTGKSESAFISYGTDNSPINVPAAAKYMRICFYESNVSYSERYSIFVVGYGKNPAFETYQIENFEKITNRDNQFFFVDSGDYTESFDVLINRGNNGNKNMIVSFKGYYTGTTAPTIQFFMPRSYNNNYYSSQIYTMGNSNFSDEQEWRVPAFPLQALQFKATIIIPSGTTLHIEYLYNNYDNAIVPYNGMYKLSAHLGTPCIYPDNTMLSFSNAAKLGYPACVVVPKRTSDGIWVCFHDDGGIGDDLRNPDGTAISSGDESKTISQLTYTEILAYSAGAKTNICYASEKVPTLEAFFELCQRTGMRPVLSTHPHPDASGWSEIKTIAEKYNILDKLTIKAASITNGISVAHDVFGDDIESYQVDVSIDSWDVVTQLNELGWSLNHARIGVEYFNSIITQTKVNEAIASGYIVACFIQNGTAARYKELLSMGVTEITDDNNCSYGLKW